MYEVFDSYLSVDTWHTSHDNDRARFMAALKKVIHEDGFSPDEMGRYMREKKGVTEDRPNEGYAFKIDHDVQDAWAVKDFFSMTGR